jgi:hypothetical protein
MVIVKIKPFTYRFLQRFAKGGKFKSVPQCRNGFYYIEIDDQVFRRLMEIDDDVDWAIICALFNFF